MTIAIRIRKMTAGCGTRLPTASTASSTRSMSGLAAPLSPETVVAPPPGLLIERFLQPAALLAHAGASRCGSAFGSAPILVRQRVQDARPGADAAVEALQLVFFVGAVNAVVGQPEPGQDDVHAKRLLELVRDRDRAAAADEHRRAPPLGGQRIAGAAEGRRLDREADGVAGA